MTYYVSLHTLAVLYEFEIQVDITLERCKAVSSTSLVVVVSYYVR